jgi:hypothetical protein
MIWYLMDSAPKDDTEILVTDGTTCAIASWGPGNKINKKTHSYEECWRIAWSEDSDYGWSIINPTYWMPLPKLPK